MSLKSGDTALVTGASSGIGEATVRSLRHRDVTVIAAARRVDRLEALAAETGAVPFELDVRDRDAVAALSDQKVDLLVNDAGLGRAMGSFIEADISDIERTLDTHVTSLVDLPRAVLPGMIDQGRGHIVNISSTAALHPIPTALYGASKGAVHKFCKDLRLELKGLGVRVSEIQPGRVETEFYDVAVDDPTRRSELADLPITQLSPSDVADAIVYVADAPWHVNVSQLEIVPQEQVYGGYHFAPLNGSTTDPPTAS